MAVPQLPESSYEDVELWQAIDTNYNIFSNSMNPMNISKLCKSDIPLFTVTLLPELYLLRGNMSCGCYYKQYIGNPSINDVRKIINLISQILTKIKDKFEPELLYDYMFKNPIAMDYQLKSLKSVVSLFHYLQIYYIKYNNTERSSNEDNSDLVERTTYIMTNAIYLLTCHTKAFINRKVRNKIPLSPLRNDLYLNVGMYSVNGKIPLLQLNERDLFEKLNIREPLGTFLKKILPKDRYICLGCLKNDSSDFAILSGCTHLICLSCAELHFYIPTKQR